MKAPVACPNCESSFSVSRLNEGKRAKCPKCAQPFLISFAPLEQIEPAETAFPDMAADIPPPISPAFATPAKGFSEPRQEIKTPGKVKKDSHSNFSTKRSIKLPQWPAIAIPALISVVLGYFIGREHLKFQMRSAFSSASEAFAKGLAGDIDDSFSTAAIETAEPEVDLPTRLMIGQTHQSDGFVVTLTSAEIATSKVKDLMGEIGTGENPDLAFAFEFTNTDDRKILRFRDGNQFMAGHFQLRDDVDNVIRGINYGFASKPVGSLTSADDITPGSTVTHVELFSVPPPKTEYLILTVNLACLGGEGEIEYKIPATEIGR
jgi:hypothetical protein